jgi:exodeoxyribonuclease V alpha subunit
MFKWILQRLKGIQMIELEGIVEDILYRNDDNGYTVAKLECNKKLHSIVGIMPFIAEGQHIKVSGTWITHKSFGEQVKVDSCEEIIPSTLEGIEKYLSSGIVNGIGPVTAKRIVEMFGEDTLDIMEMNPMRLTEVEGIGEKKALSIVESFKEQRELRSVMIFLQSYGLTPAYAVRVYRKYGEQSIKNVKENPYRLCDDITGIGFKTADKIARNLGIDINSSYRIKAGVKYILAASTANGHVYLPKLELMDECTKILNIDASFLEDAISSLIVSKEIVGEDIGGDIALFLNTMYYSELGIARKIMELWIYGETEQEDAVGELNKLAKEIKSYENSNDIFFGEEQKKAIICGATEPICIITGGPGTGKTTIIKCIISSFEKRGLNIVLGAPTGRAAKRITETTGYEAKTIHRLLEMGYTSDDQDAIFSKDETDPIEADIVIIDEASMIDVLLMNSLLKALPLGCRLILVGDVDQLPSVGPGNVLRDIIESEAVGVVRLDKIYRQSEESLITVNAHRINNGEMPELNDRDKDFFFIQKNTPTEILNEILTLACKRLPNFKEGFDALKQIQILSPMRKGDTGVHNLNNKLQELMNPPANNKHEKQFKDYLLRTGDKVMQTKNNYSIEWESANSQEGLQGTGIYNGDIGYILDIDSEAQIVKILFDEDKIVKYFFSSLDELELAYAITIHKSQGSEFPIVIIPVWNGPPMLMTRNLIYTGVTRAKRLVVLTGTKQVLQRMINNNNIAKRYTRLKYRILSILELMK